MGNAMICRSKINVRRVGGRQGGVALVTALIFLVIITALALSAMRTGTQELRMALNAEHKVTAVQKAQALSDAVVANPVSTPVVGVLGRRSCFGDVPAGEPSCTGGTLVLPGDINNALVLEADDRRFVAVERVAPELGPCPRGAGFSAEIRCSTFRVHSHFDGTEGRRGRADLYEGVLVLVPSP